MSSSYPQETGETEFREMLAAVRKNQPGKVETNVTVFQGEQTGSCLNSLLEGLTSTFCGKQQQQTDTTCVNTNIQFVDFFEQVPKITASTG